MRLSVVIPVYNVAEYLRACVTSVLTQEYQDYEVILVDDGSTDGLSGELCDVIAAEYPERIRVIHQENRGLGGARNTGLENARGEYLLFLDSDDTLTPDAIERLGAAAEAGVDVVTFYMQSVTESGEYLEVERHSIPEGTPVTLERCPQILMDTPSACTRLWKRELFIRTGIRFPEKLRFEDLYTTGKLLLEAESILGLDEILYIYLRRGGSIMRGSDPDYNRDVLLALDSLRQWYQSKGAYPKYQTCLQGMVLLHTYYAAYRVLRLAPDAPVLTELMAYLMKYVPKYKSNPYYKTMTRSQRLTLALLRHGAYGLAAGLFDFHDRLTEGRSSKN